MQQANSLFPLYFDEQGNEGLQANPADHCMLPRIIKPEIKPLVDEQITEFMRIASKDRYGDLLMIDLFSGLRQGEIVGLTWDCLDFSTGLLTVKHQLQREKKANGKYYLTTLKNDKTRTICLAPYTCHRCHGRRLRHTTNGMRIFPA